MRRWGLVLLAALLCLTVSSAAADDGGWEQIHTRTIQIEYRTHDGYLRAAYVLVPDWYGPARHPRPRERSGRAQRPQTTVCSRSAPRQLS